MRKDGIIYCKTDFTPLLFDHIRFSNRSYKLITHHSDFPIDEFRFASKPDCVKKWFAINPAYKHPDLIPIPLGTKTPEGRAYHEPQYLMLWFEESYKKLADYDKIKNRVYCNWGATNNERNKICSKLVKKVNCIKTNGLNFIEYCEDMSKYQFIISPPGNGIDCHRTWEALYLGCYPIVIKNMIYDDWKELPIIQVSNYSEVSEDFLEYYLNKTYNFEKLYADYWIKRICN